MTTPTQSTPLSEASSQSLDELFSADQARLSDTEIQAIVDELRRARKNFADSEAKGLKPRAKKSTASKPVDMNVTLDDLGL